MLSPYRNLATVMKWEKTINSPKILFLFEFKMNNFR